MLAVPGFLCSSQAAATSAIVTGRHRLEALVIFAQLLDSHILRFGGILVCISRDNMSEMSLQI